MNIDTSHLEAEAVARAAQYVEQAANRERVRAAQLAAQARDEEVRAGNKCTPQHITTAFIAYNHCSSSPMHS